MVNKLRKKFILTSMLALLVILLVMIGVINLANLHHIVSDADNLLAMLSDNDGNFPGIPDFNAGPDPNAPFDDNIGNPFLFDQLSNIRSAEMPFQSRYFWVKYNSLSQENTVNIEHTAAVTQETALSYADEVLSTSKKDRGFYHSYRYRITSQDNGITLVIFTDMSSQILDAFTLLLQTLLIGLCALVAMFILVFLFSGKAVAPVVESLDKQKRFITDAGHELKTPLAVISANVDVLELESGKSEWTDSIRNQTKRMNGLVKDLLTLSRMDEERPQVVFSNFDMSSAIKEIATSFEAIATSKEKKYHMNIEDNISITGDKNSINQLASLLLDNAMKYTSEKGDINVTLKQGKYITFEVSNTCDSIPSGNLDRLFDRFYRADSSRARETGGYGIGLSVARAIATAHGGSIEASKEGDNLIKFIVTLPKQLPKSIKNDIKS